VPARASGPAARVEHVPARVSGLAARVEHVPARASGPAARVGSRKHLTAFCLFNNPNLFPLMSLLSFLQKNLDGLLNFLNKQASFILQFFPTFTILPDTCSASVCSIYTLLAEMVLDVILFLERVKGFKNVDLTNLIDSSSSPSILSILEGTLSSIDKFSPLRVRFIFNAPLDLKVLQ